MQHRLHDCTCSIFWKQLIKGQGRLLILRRAYFHSQLHHCESVHETRAVPCVMIRLKREIIAIRKQRNCCKDPTGSPGFIRPDHVEVIPVKQLEFLTTYSFTEYTCTINQIHCAVLVVGCGNMGASHATAYHGLEGVEICGLVSKGKSKEVLNEKLGGGYTLFDDYTMH